MIEGRKQKQKRKRLRTTNRVEGVARNSRRRGQSEKKLKGKQVSISKSRAFSE